MAIELRHFDDALNTVLAGATITGISATDIAWPEKTYVPVKGVPYIKPEIAARSRRPMGVGANCVEQWDGVYQVGIFVPRDTGTRLQNTIAGQVLAAFPRGLNRVTPQGVHMTITRGTAPIPVPFGDWVSLPVQIEWFAFEPPP